MIDKPIITKDNLIIGGHQRIMMLKKMGVKEIEVYVADEDLNDKDIEELNIRLNKVSGDWDWDILANQYEMKDLVEWGFSGEDFDFPNIEIDEEEKKEDCGKCVTCGRKIKAKGEK